MKLHISPMLMCVLATVASLASWYTVPFKVLLPCYDIIYVLHIGTCLLSMSNEQSGKSGGLYQYVYLHRSAFRPRFSVLSTLPRRS